MNWKNLASPTDLDLLREASFQSPQVIFKHSSRCATSGLAMGRLQRQEGLQFHLVDVIHHRDLSNKIADDFKVWHESPQVLIIHNGECTYEESHLGIRGDEIMEQLAA